MLIVVRVEEKICRKRIMGSPLLSSENTAFAQVVVDMGNTYGLTSFPTRCRDPVPSLIAITGKEDNRLNPFFLKSDSFVSGHLTTSPAVKTGLFQVP